MIDRPIQELQNRVHTLLRIVPEGTTRNNARLGIPAVGVVYVARGRGGDL